MDDEQCKWEQDEMCVNADCPLCADFCIAAEPGVCRFDSRQQSLNPDEAAHLLMDFSPEKVFEYESRYYVFYHERRLYSVRDQQRGTLTLIHASSPLDALQKAK